MKIRYWSDYACPYCYIGETRLKKAVAEMGLGDMVELEMNAFELDPTAPTEPVGDTLHRFAAKYGLTLKQAEERIEDISQLGREEGIDFRYATTRNTNTFDAHRLTKYAHSVGNTAIEGLLFDAYFTKNLVLADHAVLLDIAREAGLDTDAAAEVLEGDAFADEVRADEQEARARAVEGVPYFVIDDKLAVPGALPTDLFKQALTQVLNEELSTMKGATCGPDGCGE